MNLILYVVMVTVIVAALIGYTHHVSARLDAADRISCANRRVLIANQRLVLRIISRNIHVLLSWTRVVDNADRRFLLRSRGLLERAEFALLSTPSCPFPKGTQP